MDVLIQDHNAAFEQMCHNDVNRTEQPTLLQH